jgi:hypothetical protein
MPLPAACLLQSVTLANSLAEDRLVEGGFVVPAEDSLVIDMSDMTIYLKERLRTAFLAADAGGDVTIADSDPSV